MSAEWLADLAEIGTDWRKPFLETAPWLIILFRRIYDLTGDQKRQNYYVMESVGLAGGFLLTAIHKRGPGGPSPTPPAPWIS